MPFYEYSCEKCGARFDLMRRMAERDDPAVCPECGHKGAKRGPSRVTASVRGGSAPACDSANSCANAGSFG
ncbi:MAG: zinc ribbon domain-containing protein [Candidatus Eisenbacteria bacterium]|nr:zinc ribbon domain-containing protein [Candidatus Eisenbacteria bacterium]